MAGVNLVMLVGNLGRDPETKYTQAGEAVTKFKLAINETWKGKDGEKKERTEWVPVVCFDHLAEICEKYLGSGDKVLVIGRFNTREYAVPDSQEKKRVSQVVAEKVVFLVTRNKGDEPNGERPGPGDDVPF